jgi:hypothetical protein
VRRFDGLAERCKQITQKAPRIEPDELKLHEEVNALIHDGLAFMIDWQQQEIALRSWLQEAFTRDRGVAD